jgi:hypothetical protein
MILPIINDAIILILLMLEIVSVGVLFDFLNIYLTHKQVHP